MLICINPSDDERFLTAYEAEDAIGLPKDYIYKARIDGLIQSQEFNSSHYYKLKDLYQLARQYYKDNNGNGK